jgi:thioredoxin reductase (NADPH)
MTMNQPRAGRAGSVPPAPLSEDQMRQLRALGSEVRAEAGMVLFTPGEPGYDLFVVVEGSAQIVDETPGANQRVVADYGPGEFLGEIGMLLGEPVRLGGVMAESGRVLRVPIDAVRALMADNAELSDTILHAFLVRRAALVRRGVGVTLVGSRYDPHTRSLTEFFARNRIALRWIDLEADRSAEELLKTMAVPVEDLPMVLIPGRAALRRPDLSELAAALGTSSPQTTPEPGLCDLVVVGGGPAGLAAAVYGGSEGLSTTLVDAIGFGGQAGTSSRIENYLGFPAGVSGAELTARAVIQAQKFDVTLRGSLRAAALASHDGIHEITCEDGTVVTAKSLIIATGARYRTLPIQGREKWEGSGIYYAATHAESRFCDNAAVAVIGGANSAGQAAMFLARNARVVHVLVRGADLEHSMSRYLIDAITSNPKIKVHLRTEAVSTVGDQALSGLTVVRRDTGEQSGLHASAVFIFIGATPCTDWLAGQLATDAHDFLLTGGDLPDFPSLGRHPFTYETSRPGVFAIGDVRSGSVKRVAAAVGEGSAAVRMVFEQLKVDRAEI